MIIFNIHVCSQGGTVTCVIYPSFSCEMELDNKNLVEMAQQTPNQILFSWSFDIVFVSHMLQAPLWKPSRAHGQVVVEPRLREPSLGKFEGMVKSEIYSQFLGFVFQVIFLLCSPYVC